MAYNNLCQLKVKLERFNLGDDKSKINNILKALQPFMVLNDEKAVSLSVDAVKLAAENLREALNRWVGNFVQSDENIIREFSADQVTNIDNFNKKNILNFSEIYQTIFDLQIALTQHHPSSNQSPFTFDDLCPSIVDPVFRTIV